MEKLKQVETVLGTVNSSNLGVTLPHEHIFVDLRCCYTPPLDPSLRWLVNAPVTKRIRPLLLKDALISKDNPVLNNELLAIEELQHFKKLGGGTVVCQSLPGIGRKAKALKQVSIKTGLHIIASTGWYLYSSHPRYVKHKSADELADIMIGELRDGIEGTEIKAGLIGECGCSEPIPYHPEEKKVLQAACRAQEETNVAFTFHPADYDRSRRAIVKVGFEYINLIEAEGANIEKFFLSHADLSSDKEYQRKLLEKGINLSFDGFGQEESYNSIFAGAGTPSDEQRIRNLVFLIQLGFEKQIMLSQDVFEKIHLKHYGGQGYSHILKNIVPRLLNEGVNKRQINSMLVENPKRILER